MDDFLFVLVVVLILVLCLSVVWIWGWRDKTGAAENVENPTYWRNIIQTIQDSNFEVLSIDPGNTSKFEGKPNKEQILLVESGSGVVVDKSKSRKLKPRDIIRFPSTSHVIKNTSNEQLKLYSFHS